MSHRKLQSPFRIWWHLLNGRAKRRNMHFKKMEVFADSRSRAYSAAYGGICANQVLPQMPPHALLVPRAQIEGFKKTPHLPQKVPYAHMVTYTPAAHAASSTDTEPGHGRALPGALHHWRAVTRLIPVDFTAGSLRARAIPERWIPPCRRSFLTTLSPGT